MHFSKGQTMLGGLLLMGLLYAVPGHAVPISNSVLWTGGGDFNNASIGFSGFSADTLISVTPDSASGFFHTHNSTVPETMFVDVFLDGTWTQIFSATTTNGPRTAGDNELASTISNVAFSFGTVSGLRLRSQVGVNFTYHSMSGETFNFGIAGRTVPEPATFALVALGLAGFGLRKQAHRNSLPSRWGP